MHETPVEEVGKSGGCRVEVVRLTFRRPETLFSSETWVGSHSIEISPRNIRDVSGTGAVPEKRERRGRRFLRGRVEEPTCVPRTRHPDRTRVSLGVVGGTPVLCRGERNPTAPRQRCRQRGGLTSRGLPVPDPGSEETQGLRTTTRCERHPRAIYRRLTDLHRYQRLPVHTTGLPHPFRGDPTDPISIWNSPGLLRWSTSLSGMSLFHDPFRVSCLLPGTPLGHPSFPDTTRNFDP